MYHTMDIFYKYFLQSTNLFIFKKDTQVDCDNNLLT